MRVFQTSTSAPTTGLVAMVPRVVTVDRAVTPATAYLDSPVVTARLSPMTALTYLVRTEAHVRYTFTTFNFLHEKTLRKKPYV